MGANKAFLSAYAQLISNLLKEEKGNASLFVAFEGLGQKSSAQTDVRAQKDTSDCIIVLAG